MKLAWKQIQDANVARPAPAEVDGDVIVSVARAIHKQIPSLRIFAFDKLIISHDGDGDMLRNMAIAAANVLLDALRGPVTEQEESEWNKIDSFDEAVSALIQGRIDRVLKPKDGTK